MDEIARQVESVLDAYDDPAIPRGTADALQALWLQFEAREMGVIKAEQRAQQETVGISVSVLRAIGRQIGKVARKRVADFLPLARLLWNAYGREGRVVAVTFLGPMELAAPDEILPVLMELCRTCITWEDADQLAMRALEPVVRKDPQTYLPALVPWLADGSKWVRRTGVTVAGRLPMKQPAYTTRCLALAEGLLLDGETDVKRAVSFAIRLAARGDPAPVRAFLERHVPPRDSAATWVLCDTIRSMAKKLLPEFAPLLPRYRRWATDPALSSRDRRSVESAVKVLEGIA